MGRVHQIPEVAAHAGRRAGILRSRVQAPGGMVGDTQCHSRRPEAPRQSCVCLTNSDRERCDAQRAHLPGRSVEDAPPGRPCGEDHRGAGGIRSGPARRLASCRRAVEGDPPLQGLRLDSDAAMPLAVQLLSEPCHGPDQRLDGRNLSTLGGRARGVDPVPGALVPGAGQPETDDRPPGLRRWRQSGSDHHARQGSGSGQGPGAGRLALSAPPRRPRLRGDRARRLPRS